MISVLGALLLLFLISIFAIKFINSIENSKVIIARGENALCLKHQIKLKQKYLAKMRKTNFKIKAFYLATLVPKTRVAAQGAIKILKSVQKTLTLKFEFDSNTSRYCKTSILFFKNKNPFFKNGKIRRSQDQSAKYFKSEGHILISSKIRPKELIKLNIKNNKQGKWLFQIIDSNFFPAITKAFSH